MKIIKSIFCKHELAHIRNIYGDEINRSGGKRSVWKCKKCERIFYKNQLYHGEHITIQQRQKGAVGWLEKLKDLINITAYMEIDDSLSDIPALLDALDEKERERNDWKDCMMDWKKVAQESLSERDRLKQRCEALEEKMTETSDILNENQVTKITVKDISTDKAIAVITNQEIITADDSIVVAFTPSYKN